MSKKKKISVDEFWNKRAQVLVGKTIKEVRYMTDEEAEEAMWYSKPLVIFFTDGTYIFPQKDDEGNDGGAIYGSHNELIFPVTRVNETYKMDEE
jgi:hypothetical protein